MRTRRRGSRTAWNRAQYWEDKKPKVLQFAEILVGAVTANPPKSGEQKKLEL